MHPAELCENAVILCEISQSLRESLASVTQRSEELRAEARAACERSREARSRSEKLAREFGVRGSINCDPDPEFVRG
jgi:hypothetical protein